LKIGEKIRTNFEGQQFVCKCDVYWQNYDPEIKCFPVEGLKETSLGLSDQVSLQNRRTAPIAGLHRSRRQPHFGGDAVQFSGEWRQRHLPVSWGRRPSRCAKQPERRTSNPM
jgi:hypothetical protein